MSLVAAPADRVSALEQGDGPHEIVLAEPQVGESLQGVGEQRVVGVAGLLEDLEGGGELGPGAFEVALDHEELPDAEPRDGDMRMFGAEHALAHHRRLSVVGERPREVDERALAASIAMYIAIH